MKEKILAIVADKMRIDVDKITDDANLVEDLGYRRHCLVPG